MSRAQVDYEVLLQEAFEPDRLKPVTGREKAKFLVLISEGFSMKRAAEALNRARWTFQMQLDNDPKFREDFERAFEASADALEDEAWRRSHERGRYRLGSDRLLEGQLKARRPWRYGEHIQVTGAGGGPIRARVDHVDHAAVLDVLASAGLISPGPVGLPSGSE